MMAGMNIEENEMKQNARLMYTYDISLLYKIEMISHIIN